MAAGHGIGRHVTVDARQIPDLHHFPLYFGKKVVRLMVAEAALGIEGLPVGSVVKDVIVRIGGIGTWREVDQERRPLLPGYGSRWQAPQVTPSQVPLGMGLAVSLFFVAPSAVGA